MNREIFAELARTGSAPGDAWPDDEDPASYGLERSGERIVPSGRFDPLSTSAIREAMSSRARAWLVELDLRPVVDSTNAELMARADLGSVAGRVCTAELQLAGRGRRGRTWFSPFAANLALSLGVRLTRPPAELGGASLVVGLAVLDALEGLGVPDLALKWPNDVLAGDAKLGGILIEMTRSAAVELVVGIGLNVALPDAVRARVPQQVTDLAALGPPPPRSVLAGRVISAVVEFLGEFDTLGFQPFRRAFDQRHRYQGQPCRVLQPGGAAVSGTVVGVSEDGGLLMDTAEGIREFHGGEVSLRQPVETGGSQ